MKNILVVDDDQDILLSIKQIFEHEGFDVETVTSGEECIEHLEKGFKGIVLIDIMMPSMDGWDTIREIVDRGFTQDIEILVITANGTANREKMIGLEPYVQDYIVKPFDMKSLVENIKNLI